jgi:hypothetical protein
MPDEKSSPPTGTTGSDGGSFDVGSFLSEAAAAPTAPTPEYEDNTKSDGGTQGSPSQKTVEEPPEQAELPLFETQPKRSLQEIQQYRSTQAKSRKFEGLTEDEVSIFKNMSQEAYEKLYPMYLDSKKSADRIKELEETSKSLENRRWYEEENAYQLHPDFKSAQKLSDNLDTEEEFWQNQLTAVEKGEKWYKLSTNDKGEYLYGEIQEPSPEAKSQIINNLTKVAQYKTHAASKIEDIKSTFSDRYKKFNQGLTEVDKEIFGNLKFDSDPAIKTDYDTWLNRLPSEFRNQLPYQMLAKSAAVIGGLVKVLRSREAASVRKQAINTTVLQSGPGNGAAVASGGREARDYDRAFSDMTRKSLV